MGRDKGLAGELGSSVAERPECNVQAVCLGTDLILGHFQPWPTGLKREGGEYMGWDDIKENEASGDFTKIEAGKSVLLHILGKEPDRSVDHWIDKKTEKCTGEGCESCAKGVKK